MSISVALAVTSPTGNFAYRQVVTWVATVTNNGPGAASGVGIADSTLEGQWTGGPSSLGVGEQATFTLNYQTSDAEFGIGTNVSQQLFGVVTAVAVIGGFVQFSSSASVPKFSTASGCQVLGVDCYPNPVALDHATRHTRESVLFIAAVTGNNCTGLRLRYSPGSPGGGSVISNMTLDARGWFYVLNAGSDTVNEGRMQVQIVASAASGGATLWTGSPLQIVAM